MSNIEQLKRATERGVRGFMVMRLLIVFFATMTLICGAGWVCRKVSVLILLTYMYHKGYKPPDEDEIEACRKYVVEHVAKDIKKKITHS